ncbi:alpha/beta hydrolase [Streptococcus sp. NLN64]|uniref:alpha/beta hydrolase n=1 Tax=Streptococcus sp. NLN64 TaxID=2822799 RepID=UPI0018CB42F6|nr:alpha/beta hydrolase [Streptococcus sp. NLN64]MBG9366883.1 alpha/beta hydrolase [Streptococcus sp. NLN64]
MLDYLFFSPLGWSRYVWDKVLRDERFLNNSFDIIEFTNESFSSLTENSIDEILDGKLSLVSELGTVITSSFGTAVFVNYLKKRDIMVSNLIVIDGLESIPSLDELDLMFSDIKKVKYYQISDYYSEILTEDEQKDQDLKMILNKNLVNYGDYYLPILDEMNTKLYLSIYSKRNILSDLNTVLSKINNVIIFSTHKVELPHILIDEKDHLLMLTNPNRLLDAIFSFD